LDAKILFQIFIHISFSLFCLALCQAELLHSVALLEDIELPEEERQQHSLQFSRVALILKRVVDGSSNRFIPLSHLNLQQGKHQVLQACIKSGVLFGDCHFPMLKSVC
jgi:hypothetical protein